MKWLTRTPTLIALFILQALIFLGFGPFADGVGGTFLDTLMNGEESRAAMAAMSDSQRWTHFWVTVLLDTLFPIAYGAFFVGMALRFFGKLGKLAALPAFAAAIVDLTENTVQALALSGAADVLDAKDWLTPLKFGLFGLAGVIAVLGFLIGVAHMFTNQKASSPIAQ
ncbi:MAG: hypothetical protein R3C13_02570 [Hyphomonas sp.]|uniref:hypothetical protein n=1 Tax=Hyphomonas sp. TaxID=87 RepID=UPI003528F5CE